MRNSFYCLIFIFLFNSAYAKIYLSYGKSCGRFGDNLLSYMHTKYISYITGFPVIYSPFIYSDQLKLSKNEIGLKRNHIKIIKITNENMNFYFNELINKKAYNIKESIIFEIPYFPPESQYNAFKHFDPSWIFFEVDWNNTEFKNILRENIAPICNVDLVKIPDNKISIAIHVREGGGFDDAAALAFNPLKFPPLEFYFDALNYLLSYFGQEKKYFICIFTDHDDPKKLLKLFIKKFSQSNVEFHCRIENNRHDKNVLDDFFSLTLFNCLIRPQSNFSFNAGKIADYLVEIEPKEFKNREGVIEINKNIILKECSIIL